ncbi:MAG: type III pantothenate kinase [Candidatus Sedimenticola sp. (ex Thyasira tokunagai)]
MTPETLLIDIGNSNIKWAWVASVGESLEISAAPHKEMDIGALGSHCWGRGRVPKRVVMANVAGMELQRQLAGWMGDHWCLRPEIIETQAQAFGVTLAYRQPRQFGVDRWLTLIAAYTMGGPPACIVDSGTALTIDVIDGEGQHIGGQILPGIDLMRGALQAGTRIPSISPVVTTALLGEDTDSCIASASLHAAAALVDRVMVQAKSMIGVVPDLIFTGSGAPLLMEVVEHTGELVPDLVMQGLRRVAEEGNKP